MAEMTFVTGGARSGKSSFALEFAESLSEQERFFIATCPRVDGEMEERVTRHQQERLGRDWETIEEDIELARLVTERLSSGFGVVLLDCLTLWINNLLFQAEKTGKSIGDNEVAQLCDDLIGAISLSPYQFVVVSNEVGLGIIPDNPLARKYRDLVGTANQCFGRNAERVVLVSCGIPLYIKGSGNENYI